MHTSFYRLHRIALIVYRRRRTGKIIYFVALYVERKSHIMPDHFKFGIVQQFVNIAFAAGKKIVHANNFIARIEQFFAQGTAEKTAAAGHKNSFHS